MTRQTAHPLENLSLSPTYRPVEFFVRSVDKGRMTLDAEYQRGDVWTLDQRMSLVYSWLSGLPIPAVILNNRDTREWKRANPGYDLSCFYAVVDGKQRIETARRWFHSEFTVPTSWFEPHWVNSVEDTDDGPYVRFSGLTEVGQRHCDNRFALPCAEGHLATVQDEANLYLLLNGGGTPQTAENMARAALIAGGES